MSELKAGQSFEIHSKLCPLQLALEATTISSLLTNHNSTIGKLRRFLVLRTKEFFKKTLTGQLIALHPKFAATSYLAISLRVAKMNGPKERAGSTEGIWYSFATSGSTTSNMYSMLQREINFLSRVCESPTGGRLSFHRIGTHPCSIFFYGIMKTSAFLMLASSSSAHLCVPRQGTD